MSFQLPKFKDGKYEFCPEENCELKSKLCNGDPSCIECWLCIVDYYKQWPNLNELYTYDEIEMLRPRSGGLGPARSWIT